MGTIPCFADEIYVFSIVSCVRSSRAAISDFLGCFSGRYFILSMFQCHVRFERIFDKFSEHVELQNRWILLYQSLPLHHSPGFWLVVPGKRRLGSSGNCVTVTAGNHHPHIRGQGQVLVFQQQFWSIFACHIRACFYVLPVILAVFSSASASLDLIPHFRYYSDIRWKMEIYTLYSWHCF